MPDKNSTSYTLYYATGVIVVIATLLAVFSEGLKPLQEKNIAFDKKTKILKSVGIVDKEVADSIYNNYIKEIVIDMNGNEIEGVLAFDVDLKKERKKEPEDRLLPLYVFANDEGGNYYIMPVQGIGLWGPISGYIALKEDFSTVYGASFDHEKETPGLGAKIKDTKWFPKQFEGKKILDEKGNFTSITVKKNAKVLDDHTVSAIAGATVTSAGVDKMLKEYSQMYLSYFEKLKLQ